MKKIVKIIFILFLLVLAGCSTNHKEEAKRKYDEMVEIEFLDVEEDIVYYNVLIAEEYKWPTAHRESQFTIAKLATEECVMLTVAQQGFPSGVTASKTTVFGYAGGDNVFLWDIWLPDTLQVRFGLRPYEDFSFSEILGD